MKTTLSKIAKKLGKRGGLATKKTHGREHFKRIGSIGGKKPKKNMNKTIRIPFRVVTGKIIVDPKDAFDNWMGGYSDRDEIDTFLGTQYPLTDGYYTYIAKVTYFEGQSSHEGLWDIKPGYEINDQRIIKN